MPQHKAELGVMQHSLLAQSALLIGALTGQSADSKFYNMGSAISRFDVMELADYSEGVII